MLNYFKEVRNKLVKEGNLRKYIAYAIGEIVIVVAGILLALYLNNWNQERTDKKLEIQYYQSMNNQLKEDLNIILGEINYNQNYLNQFYYAKNLILLNDKSKIDTLGNIAINMVRFSDFRRKSNIYQTLINSGEIIKINNYKITERLQSLEETYTYINRLEENHSSIILSQIIPDIRQRIQFDPLKVENPESLFKYQFQNNFDILIILMLEKSEIYKRAKDEISSIIDLIDQEL
jgi:Family of unknown function (DUF6090)